MNNFYFYNLHLQMILFKNLLKQVFIFSVFSILLFSCEGSSEIDDILTSKVGRLYYESLPGKIRVHFEVLQEDDIKNVVIRYLNSSDVEQEIIVEPTENSALLGGFIDEDYHEILISTLTSSGKESEPISILGKADKAAVWEVLENLEFSRQFLGFGLTTSNSLQELVKIVFLSENNEGQFVEIDSMSFWTQESMVTADYRGLTDAEYEFKYCVMDEFDNSTDSISVVILPVTSKGLDKSKFSDFTLPGDAPQVLNGGDLKYVWDGITEPGWPTASFTDQISGGNDPHMVTISLGQTAELKELIYYPYPEFWWDSSNIQWFYLTTMKHFEVYGSTDPNLSGELDESWTLLGTCEVVKPSGSAYGADTEEDRRYASSGITFSLDENGPAVSYIRIRCLENYAGGTAQSIMELTLLGDVIN